MDPKQILMDKKLSYGAVSHDLLKASHAKLEQEHHKHRRQPLVVLGGLAFFPWLLFCMTFWMRSFDVRYAAERNSIRYEHLNCAEASVYLLLLPLLVTAWLTYRSAGHHADRGGKPNHAKVVLCYTFAIAWVLGYFLGDWNYVNNMEPYYEIRDLNVYPSVDPSQYSGHQLMDAGMIQFTRPTVLWLDKAIGFKNEDVHCVVPIRSGVNHSQSTFDYWAVGLNCCSPHKPEFKCGEFANPNAHWGLRMMDESKKQMFALAVKEAEAAYGLSAPHPVFLYWLSDPMTELQCYEEAGWSTFVFWVFVYFSVQLFLVLVLESVLAQM